MGRLTTFINEKIEKREIEEALRSTDVKVGAEWEFKFDNNYFDDIVHEYLVQDKLDAWENDIVDRSEMYDQEHDEWKDKHKEWEDEKNHMLNDVFYDEATEEIIKKLGRDDDIDNEVNELVQDKLDAWEAENPEPDEPEQPDDYLDTWDRSRGSVDDIVTFSKREDTLIDYMESKPDLKKYTGSGWEIHDDASLSEGLGIELVSPPMEVKDFMVCCPKIFDMIEQLGYTDNECGLHIGVSLKKGMSEIDPVKLAIFTDEDYYWKNFDGRKTSGYLYHMKELIRKEMYSRLDKYSNKTPHETISELKGMIKKAEIKNTISPDHYHGVNIEHLDSDNPYIEFRYMGGNEYHKKWDTVKIVIAHYIYNLKLSRDPNFKRKEYVLKCNRILLKLEKWVLMEELRKLRKDKDEWRNDPEEDDVWFNKIDDTKKKMIIRNLERRMTFLPTLSEYEIKQLKRWTT